MYLEILGISSMSCPIVLRCERWPTSNFPMGFRLAPCPDLSPRYSLVLRLPKEKDGEDLFLVDEALGHTAEKKAMQTFGEMGDLRWFIEVDLYIYIYIKHQACGPMC